MAAHDVNFNIPERELGRADIEFKIKKRHSGDWKWAMGLWFGHRSTKNMDINSHGRSWINSRRSTGKRTRS